MRAVVLASEAQFRDCVKSEGGVERGCVRRWEGLGTSRLTWASLLASAMMNDVVGVEVVVGGRQGEW